MKRFFKTTTLIIALILITGASAWSMNMHGNKVHASNIDGNEFIYTMIDMDKKAKKAGMNHNMKGMYHLMVYVKKGENFIDNAKAGFVVKSPDGKLQKVMAMKMGKGYGADIKMEQKGEYKIKAKIANDKGSIKDSFKYILK